MSLDFHCVERRGVERITLRRPVYVRAGTLHAPCNLRVGGCPRITQFYLGAPETPPNPLSPPWYKLRLRPRCVRSPVGIRFLSSSQAAVQTVERSDEFGIAPARVLVFEVVSFVYGTVNKVDLKT